MKTWRSLVAAMVLSGLLIPGTSVTRLLLAPAAAQSVDAIAIEGNRRIEAETIRSYFRPGPGGHLDQAAIDDGLKALIETGLFQDVHIDQSGRTPCRRSVVENPVIGRVAFEGNKKIKDEQLSAEVQSKSRAARCRARWCSPTRCGSPKSTVTFRPLRRACQSCRSSSSSNNRVDLVFEIDEGAKTGDQGRSSSSATTAYLGVPPEATSSRPARSNLLSFLGDATTSTILTASRPTATCCAAST
jgi:outer membrane protein insertion porin family